MVAIKSALVLLALGAKALATSTVVCSSELGTKSIQPNKIPRATTTVSEQITIVKKFIRKVNVVVIARPYTTTKTTTIQTTITSTANPNVKTATEHVTETQTDTEDRSFTAFSTQTISSTTMKYITQTVEASPGFTKIRQSPDYVAKVKARADDAIPVPVPVLRGGNAGAPEQYVQRIRCTKRVPVTSIKYITTTVQGPRRTIKKTSTKTVSTTETFTETEFPDDVTTTVTETSSPTVTEYNDITSTSTMTETVTVETQVPVDLYLACSDENIITTANGGKSLYYRSNNGLSYDTLDISGMSSAYECCVACMKNPKCFSSISSVSNSARCINYVSNVDNVCPNGQVKWATYKTKTDQSPVWRWSNGPCGFYGNAGNSNS